MTFAFLFPFWAHSTQHKSSLHDTHRSQQLATLGFFVADIDKEFLIGCSWYKQNARAYNVVAASTL